jgi:hypothetical protein
MKQPNDIQPISYSNKLKLVLTTNKTTKLQKKQGFDLVVSKSFLKKYFSSSNPSMS